MKTLKIIHLFIFFLLFFVISQVYAKEIEAGASNIQSAKMIRLGIQAQERKKYLDAKAYFRKALLSDPTSDKAWRYYDMAVIFALAENVKHNKNLIETGNSIKSKTETSPSSAKPSPKNNEAPTEVEFKIVDDEDGCY